MTKFNVIGFYTIATSVEVEAKDTKEAIELAKKKIGRDIDEYENVDFEVEESFI